jgi:hypothetical protein
MSLQLLMSWAFVGGRDRDRTCDPYHVNEGRGEEEAEIRALSESSRVVLGMRFPACSGSAVQRTKGHYVALRHPLRPLRKDEQQQMPKPRHIEGRHATRVATEVAMREPVRLSADAGDEHRPVDWPPFRPDTRHNLEGLRLSSSTGLCLTTTNVSN